MMEFETGAQKSVYEKILPWIGETFGEFTHFMPDTPVIGINVGSAIAWVSVYPWGEEDATILTRSYVVTGAEVTFDLALYLLKENNLLRFGAFGLDEAGNIFFDQTIVGSTCDPAELKASVLAVATTADHYDDRIIAQWGGRRAVDLVP